MLRACPTHPPILTHPTLTHPPTHPRRTVWGRPTAGVWAGQRIPGSPAQHPHQHAGPRRRPGRHRRDLLTAQRPAQAAGGGGRLAHLAAAAVACKGSDATFVGPCESKPGRMLHRDMWQERWHQYGCLHPCSTHTAVTVSHPPAGAPQCASMCANGFLRGLIGVRACTHHSVGTCRGRGVKGGQKRGGEDCFSMVCMCSACQPFCLSSTLP